MESQPSDAVPAGEAEAPSAELVAMLKRQLNEKAEQVASLRVYKEQYDSRNRDFLGQTQETAVQYTKDMAGVVSEHNQQYVPALQDFAAKMHATPAERLDQQMPLAVMIDCASADKKRARDAETKLAESTEALQAANQKADAATAEKDKYFKLYTEMQKLAEERQNEAEDLSTRYQALVGNARRQDFRHSSSREQRLAPPTKDAPTTGLDAASRAIEAPPLGAVTTTLDVASGKSKMPYIDPTSALSAFVAGQGAGGNRVMRAASAHHLLGASSDGASSASASSNPELIAAIRAAL